MTRSLAALAALALMGALPAAPASAAHHKTYIGGQDFGVDGFDVLRSEHPRSLVLGPLDGSLAELTRLQRIRWNGWGHATATATAKTRTKTYDPWTHVTVRAYRRRTCRASRPFNLYTRVRTTAYGRTRTWEAPSCSVVLNYTEPERLCASDLGALLYAPRATTTCAMARRIGSAYERTTGGEIADYVRIRTHSPEDGRVYTLMCQQRQTVRVECTGRKHRASIEY